MTPGRTRPDRADSFVGIHFDFHAGRDCTEIGRDVTLRMVENIIRKVRPDFIQCDCKGHPGVSCYPTEVGNPAPGFVRDQLRIWREVTAKYGVALYMHYSGVIDRTAIKKHPSWAARTADGSTTDKNATSVFGPYVDKLMIPQFKELIDNYGVDGVWVDGECWGASHDYSRWAMEAWKKKTGLRTAPKKPGDRNWQRFSEFCRQGFRDYLEHYVEEIHQYSPGFQIASNWAYSGHMPEPPEIDVDYLSGDYSLENSVNAARFEARCLAPQGKPWDLMAWSFAGTWEDRDIRNRKAALQLKQEAAVTLALGGGFQAYYKQKRDGSIFDEDMEIMGEVAEFCRERQKCCHRAVTVPQVGVIFSGEAYYHQNETLFRPWDGFLDPMRGILQTLLDGQNAVDIVMEHHLEENMNRYSVLVFPEWQYIGRKLKRKLLSYVENGGRLIIAGARTVRLFRKELGITFKGRPKQETVRIKYKDQITAISGAEYQKVLLKRETKTFGRLYGKELKGRGTPAASIRKLGKGYIAGLYVDTGNSYHVSKTCVMRDYMSALVNRLFSRPLVRIEGTHNVDVVPVELNGRLQINLINTSGPHADANVYVFDDIPPVGPFEVTIRLPKRPQRITRQPGQKKMKFTWSKGKVRLKIDRLEIHTILIIT